MIDATEMNLEKETTKFECCLETWVVCPSLTGILPYISGKKQEDLKNVSYLLEELSVRIPLADDYRKSNSIWPQK